MNIKIGVIGTGYWGRNILRNVHGLGALAAFCDASEVARTEFQAAYPEAVAYAAVDQLLADPKITAVTIVTPAATHGALVAKALAAGKHVFVEKPLCLDVEEGRRLAAQAKAKGLVLMVGHLLLYHPAFRALEATVRKGRLGRLRYIYSNRLSLGKIRREENALWSFAPHDVSMILKLTGAMPERASTNGGSWLSPTVADTTLSHLTFADGVQAHIFVSWMHPYKDHRMVVAGDEAMVVFDDVQSGPDKLRLYRHAVGWDGDIPAVHKADAEPIPYSSDEPLRLELSHFIDCVEKGAVPVSDAEEGLRVLAVLDACQTSLAEGRAVALEGWK